VNVCLKLCKFSILASTLFAWQAYSYDELWDWTPAKSGGMGRALSTFGADVDAIVTNPAGIAKSRNPRSRKWLQHLDLPQFSVGGNQLGLAVFGKGGVLPTKFPDALYNSIQENSGAHVAIQQIFPNVTFGSKGTPTFFFGMYGRAYYYAEKSQVVQSETYLSTHQTAGLALGIADTLFGGRLAYGIMVRPNLRYAMETKYFLAEDSESFKSFFNSVKSKGAKSTATAIDAGIIYMYRSFWAPSLAVSVRNMSPTQTGCLENYINPLNGNVEAVCGLLRKGGEKISYGPSNLDPLEIRAGFSITPRTKLSTEKINLRLAAELAPLPLDTQGYKFGAFTEEQKANVISLASFGTELFFGRANINRGFGLRAAYSKQDLTYGATLALGGLVIDYSSYAAKIYVQSGLLDERRHTVGISTDW
jgi:hypothetical protein